MKCSLPHDQAFELAVDYVSGTLQLEAYRRFEGHLAICHRCRDLVAAHRELWQSLDSWTPIQPSPGFNARLFQRIAGERQPSFRLSLGKLWQSTLPLAAASLAVITAFWIHQPSAPADPNQHAPAIEQVERALDDLDMLKTIGAANIVSPESPEKM